MLTTLFLTFLKIGLFTFGGGYAMLSLIQSEVVVDHAWISSQEFADIVAVSQMTPGPVGINTATYTGYTTMLNAGHPQAMAVLAGVLCSVAVVLLPVILMFVMLRLLNKFYDRPVVRRVMRLLRFVVVGLIAAAAIRLATPESFGRWADCPRQVVMSAAIFAAVFLLSLIPKKRVSPILLLLASGAVGFIVM
ncbi:MAG: chromate transporter [Bacteroidales bacterium]|nr:chromate transporter [Bacteroidales bacterium]